MRGCGLALFLSHDHPLIPRTALEAVNSIRRRAHRGSDGGGGERLRPGRRRGIGRRSCTTDRIERGRLRWTGRGCGRWFGLVLASGTLTEGGSIRGGEVQGSTEVPIFFLQLCDALLEGLFREKKRESINGREFEIRRIRTSR